MHTYIACTQQYLDLEVLVMRAVRIQPEDSQVASGTSAGNCELNPVPDGQVLALAHTPDIAFLDVVLEHLLHVCIYMRSHTQHLQSGL